MRKQTILLAVISLLVAAPVFAQQRDVRGPSARAYEKASERSIIHRAGDFFATVGRSQEEKDQIISKRSMERARRQAERKSREMKKQAEKARGDMGKALR